MFDKRIPLIGLLILTWILPGCATLKAKRKTQRDLQSVLDQATELMGERRIVVKRKPFRSDCSGFVTACYSRVDVTLVDPTVSAKSGTELIFKSLKKRGRIVGVHRAKPGDLAFFHNTWDKNGNRLRDDRFTHIALVEKVDGKGRVQIVHFVSGRVKRGYITPSSPGQARDSSTGRILNSHLRRGGGKTLTGQLLFRFGRPLPP
jgi:hypothetical protein